MSAIRFTLAAAAALGALAVTPITSHACSQYTSTTAQLADQGLTVIRWGEAEMNAPLGVDLVRFIAQQEATMDAMFQQVDAMATQALRKPDIIRAGIWPFANGPASIVMVSSFSNGQAVCSETVTYTYGANGLPQVSVKTTGNACGEATMRNDHTPAATTPPLASPAPYTIKVKGPARAVAPALRG
jgi:hypothetical protein